MQESSNNKKEEILEKITEQEELKNLNELKNKDDVIIENNEELIKNENIDILDSNEKTIKNDNNIKKEDKMINFLLKIIYAFFFIFILLLVTIFSNNKEKTIEESNIYIANPKKVVVNNVENGNVMTASQIYENNIDSIVAINVEAITPSIFGNYIATGSGSGFIISEDGYIITNYHVIESSTEISVTMANGKEYQAKLVGSEPDNDIAIIKLETEDKFTPVILGASKNIRIGEDIVAIGNPLGELNFSITKGIVSAINRNIQVDDYTTIDMFQVDCAVNEGNSGGPIFNMYGEVIGIVSLKYASETIEGLGFAIPIDDVTFILSDLIEHGKVINKAYLGISVTELTDEMIEQLSLVEGAYISTIEEGSCAEKAGLKVRDIITMLGEDEILTVTDLLTTKRKYKAGETTILKVWRDGEYLDLTITFDEYVEPIEEESKEVIIENNSGDMFGYSQYPSEDFILDFMFGNMP